MSPAVQVALFTALPLIIAAATAVFAAAGDGVLVAVRLLGGAGAVLAFMGFVVELLALANLDSGHGFLSIFLVVAAVALGSLGAFIALCAACTAVAAALRRRAYAGLWRAAVPLAALLIALAIADYSFFASELSPDGSVSILRLLAVSMGLTALGALATAVLGVPPASSGPSRAGETSSW